MKATDEQLFREFISKEWLENYSKDADNIIFPRFIDAVAASDVWNDLSICEVLTNLSEIYQNKIGEIKKNRKLNLTRLPNTLFSLVIPLDFYIPIQEPYHACGCEVSKSFITSFNCATIISSNINVANSRTKISYIIVSICSEKFGRTREVKQENIEELLIEALKICNEIISVYQAIPSRHNHYMHILTKNLLPGSIQVFTANWKKNRILEKDTISIHSNVISEVFQSRTLEDDERDFFVTHHHEILRSSDKIYLLISKFNDAINEHCFGKNESSIVLVDNYVELAVGYLYYQSSIEKGIVEEEVIKEYRSFKNSKQLMEGFSILLEISFVDLLKRIGFEDWNRNCRNVRNEIVHNFISDQVDSEEAFNAIFYSGHLIGNLCDILIKTFSQSNNARFLNSLLLLKSSTIYADTIHQTMKKYVK